jgi:hypothetical protein
MSFVEVVERLIRRICELAGQDYEAVMAELAKRSTVDTSATDAAAKRLEDNLPDG